MRRAALGMLLMSLTAGCAVAPQAAAEDEKDHSIERLYVCLERAAKQDDDYVSDASSIAFSLIGTCGRQFVEVDQTQFRDQSLEMRAMLARSANDRRLKIALAAVLRNRKNARQGGLLR